MKLFQKNSRVSSNYTYIIYVYIYLLLLYISIRFVFVVEILFMYILIKLFSHLLNVILYLQKHFNSFCVKTYYTGNWVNNHNFAAVMKAVNVIPYFTQRLTPLWAVPPARSTAFLLFSNTSPLFHQTNDSNEIPYYLISKKTLKLLNDREEYRARG